MHDKRMCLRYVGVCRDAKHLERPDDRDAIVGRNIIQNLPQRQPIYQYAAESILSGYSMQRAIKTLENVFGERNTLAGLRRVC